MNSFNHYAYGAVADWLYGVTAGISINAGGEGYTDITVAPKPCERLGFVRCSIDTPQGVLESNWYYTADGIRFEISIPKGAKASIKLPDGYECRVGAGNYHFTATK
jgi:alpha-L-rhamnosidase